MSDFESVVDVWVDESLVDYEPARELPFYRSDNAARIYQNKRMLKPVWDESDLYKPSAQGLRSI